MLKKLKSMFRSRTPPAENPVRVIGRFDAAQTTRDNIRHWAMADYLSADQEANPEIRKTLRMRSRYEVANNSYAKGLVQMLANDTIGTGPRIQLLTEDEHYNDEIEREFMAWAEAIRLPQKLRMMRVARCQDGESFAAMVTNPKVNHPVKMDIQLLEADRIAGELQWKNDDNSVDGITYDDWGNPVSYRVLKYHPGDEKFSTGREAFHIPAEYMLHIFRADRPGLHRGIPELTAALPLFAQLRRYNLAVLSAAEAAADFAAILYTDAPPDGEAERVPPMDALELERNMMLTVPAGWKMAQLDAKQPTANHAEFVKIILSEIARCAVSTYGSVSGDFSGHNYASGRLDNQLYHKSVLVDRAFWESEVLNQIFAMWFREYSLVNPTGEFRTPRHTWFWDGFVHVDPTKEANAQQIRLANHTTTLAAECAKDGRDYMSVLRQRAKEIKLMREYGIPVPGEQPASQPTESEEDSQQQENEKDE